MGVDLYTGSTYTPENTVYVRIENRKKKVTPNKLKLQTLQKPVKKLKPTLSHFS